VSNVPSLSQAELSFSHGIISTVLLVPSSSLLSIPFQPLQTRKHKQFSENIVVKYGYKHCSNAAEFKQNGIEP